MLEQGVKSLALGRLLLLVLLLEELVEEGEAEGGEDEEDEELRAGGPHWRLEDGRHVSGSRDGHELSLTRVRIKVHGNLELGVGCKPLSPNVLPPKVPPLAPARPGVVPANADGSKPPSF